jgi:hypothetical protein
VFSYYRMCSLTIECAVQSHAQVQNWDFTVVREMFDEKRAAVLGELKYKATFLNTASSTFLNTALYGDLVWRMY